MKLTEKQIAAYCIAQGYIKPAGAKRLLAKHKEMLAKGVSQSFISLLAEHCGWSRPQARDILLQVLREHSASTSGSRTDQDSNITPRATTRKEKNSATTNTDTPIGAISTAATLEIPALATQEEMPSVIKKYGHFEVLSLLGQGAMGVVYLARDTSLERQVALKVLPPEFYHNQKMVRRFLLEARTMAKISHPNIVQVYFVGQQGQEHFMAMEYIAGRSLEQIVKEQGGLPLDRALEYIRQAAYALKAAAAQNIIHRDIKPANLMLTPAEIIKVTDFGIAKKVDVDQGLTSPGMIVGSPLFMSPEQGRGEELDLRSDIYSLGVTFFYLLTGTPPYTGKTAASIIFKHTTEPIPPLRLRHGEPPLACRKLLLKMMAKNVNERYRNYDLMLADIEQLLRNLHSTFTAHHRGTLADNCKTSKPCVAEELVLPHDEVAAPAHLADDVDSGPNAPAKSAAPSAPVGEQMPAALAHGSWPTVQERLLAFAIDFLPLLLFFKLFASFQTALNLAFLGFVVEHTVMLPSRGQTIGKSFVGLRVLDANGRYLPMPFAACRALLIVFSIFPLLGIPFLFMKKPPHNTLHDVLLQTREISIGTGPPHEYPPS